MKKYIVMVIMAGANVLYVFAAQQRPEDALRNAQEQVDVLTGRINTVHQQANNTVFRINESMGLAHNANTRSINAYETSTRALAEANRAIALANDAIVALQQTHQLPERVTQAAQTGMTNLDRECTRLRNVLTQTMQQQQQLALERAVQVEQAKIHEKQRLGLFTQKERIMAQAAIDVEMTRWNRIQALIDDPKRIVKIVLALTAVALGAYIAAYGIPLLINYFTQPRVISETSRSFLFDWDKERQKNELSDLIFADSLQTQLSDLMARVQTAKIYNERLPNVLFYGASGTGKTAFAKLLAYCSELDYAITSGSEFAKITDLNEANNELRKLLHWAQNSDKGLIVFIDETESLFVNRKFSNTSKHTQDFINTFLALVPEASQKKLMFIFATNYPFKIDDAIMDRIGIKVEFVLPEVAEREKIFTLYLKNFAQENELAPVVLHPKVMRKLSGYAKFFEGMSPRAIKFVAEEMVIKARRTDNKQLTHDIAQKVLNDAMYNIQQAAQWEKDRHAWTIQAKEAP